MPGAVWLWCDSWRIVSFVHAGTILCGFRSHTVKVPESDAPSVALMRQLTQSLLSLSTQAQSCALRQLTSSGRVWRKLLESDARSVALPHSWRSHCFLCPRRHHPVFSVPHRQGGPEVWRRPSGPQALLWPRQWHPPDLLHHSHLQSTLVSAWASAPQYSFFSLSDRLHLCEDGSFKTYS